MKTIYAGPRGNVGPGQDIDLPPKEARALIAGGYAVAPAPEAGMRPPPESSDHRAMVAADIETR